MPVYLTVEEGRGNVRQLTAADKESADWEGAEQPHDLRKPGWLTGGRGGPSGGGSIVHLGTLHCNQLHCTTMP